MTHWQRPSSEPMLTVESQTVPEPTVMRRDDQRPGPSLQRRLEYRYGLDVEVVGGLVKREARRASVGDDRQVRAGPLSR